MLDNEYYSNLEERVAYCGLKQSSWMNKIHIQEIFSEIYMSRLSTLFSILLVLILARKFQNTHMEKLFYLRFVPNTTCLVVNTTKIHR